MKLDKFIQHNELRFDNVFIVGKGPSLEFINENHFGEGAIITLNEAIVKIETLRINNLIFSMQKDGGIHKNSGGEYIGINKCFCEEIKSGCAFGMVRPRKPTTVLLVCENCSKECFIDYSPRVVFDNNDYFLQWFDQSVLSSIFIAKQLGAKKITMVCFDSFTHNDLTTYLPTTGERIPNHPYFVQHEKIKELLADIDHEFITPKK